MPETFSPVVSLANLNQVYTELNNRIESLNTVYNPKGSDTKAGVTAKTGNIAGDVWNITDSFTNAGVTIPADTNWVYVTAEPNIAAKDYFAASGSGYWVRVGSFLDIARDDKAGLICTGTSSIDSANDADGTSFDRGLKLKGTNKAYITLPKATTSIYGVVTTGTQSFAGEKTFTNNVNIIDSNLSVTGTITASGGTALTATLLTDTLKVQNLVDIEGDFTTGSLTAKNAAGTANVNVTWKPESESSLTLQTDQITATNSLSATSFIGIETLSATSGSPATAHNVTLTNDTTKINTQLITLSTAAGLSAQSFTGIGALSAKTGSGASETYNNITLSHATTEINTPLLDICYPDPSDSSKSLGNIEAQSFTGIGTLSATKGSAKNNITLSHIDTEIDTPKITLSGSNGLSATTFSGINDLDASSNNITLSGTTQITTGTLTANTGITADTVTATGKTITLGQNCTLTTPIVIANTSLTTGTLTAASLGPAQIPNTNPAEYYDFSVAINGTGTAVTAGSLQADTITVSTLSSSGTLTVSSNITAASLGAKTADTYPALSADTISVGTIQLTTANHKTLTVNSSTTVASLTAQTANVYPAVSADSVSVGTFSASGQTLTIDGSTGLTAGTMDTDSLIAGSVTVNTLSASGKTLTIDGSTASTAGYVDTDSLTASSITVGTFSADGKTLTIDGSSGSTAGAVNVSNTLSVTGSGAAMTVGTLNGGTAATGATKNFLTLGNSNLTGTGTNINNFTSPTKSSSFPLSSASLCVYGGGSFKGGIEAAKVFNAVWNDLSDRIEIDIKPEPGYAYALKDGHYQKTSKYMDQGYIGIESDTSGFEMGGKDTEFELNVSVAGFVLAYVDKVYKPGTPLTVTKGGKLTKIKAIGRILHPEMVVATFWKPELKPTFGPEGGEKQVNGRMWVKIK